MTFNDFQSLSISNRWFFPTLKSLLYIAFQAYPRSFSFQFQWCFVVGEEKRSEDNRGEQRQ
jgi:hypothetical protein